MVKKSSIKAVTEKREIYLCFGNIEKAFDREDSIKCIESLK